MAHARYSLTCFTGTKVQILTQKRYAGVDHVGWEHDKHIERLLLSKTISSAAKSLTHIVGVMIDRCALALLRQYLYFWYFCTFGTKVQILMQKRYKSTNTDTEAHRWELEYQHQ